VQNVEANSATAAPNVEANSATEPLAGAAEGALPQTEARNAFPAASNAEAAEVNVEMQTESAHACSAEPNVETNSATELLASTCIAPKGALAQTEAVPAALGAEATSAPLSMETAYSPTSLREMMQDILKAQKTPTPSPPSVRARGERSRPGVRPLWPRSQPANSSAATLASVVPDELEIDDRLGFTKSAAGVNATSSVGTSSSVGARMDREHCHSGTPP
jgi:hypothetical protein